MIKLRDNIINIRDMTISTRKKQNKQLSVEKTEAGNVAFPYKIFCTIKCFK